MEALINAVVVFLQPLYRIANVPNDRIYWVYLLSAYAIALIAALRGRHGWSLRDVAESLRQLVPARILLHRSAVADYKMLFVNNFSYFYLFPLIIVGSGVVAAASVEALKAAGGGEPLGISPDWTSRLALTLLWLLAWDFGFFFAHYLQHKVPLLWEFHKVHHSAEVLTPATLFRMHPVDDLLTISMVAAMIGLVEGAFLFVYADPVTGYLINGLNVAWFVFLVFGYHLRHSHIWILFPRPLRYLISSPALHQIHHSADPKHFDKNFARIFVFWDKLAGTLYIPEDREEIRYGLRDGEHLEYDSLWKLYVLPFRKVGRRWRTRWAPS